MIIENVFSFEEVDVERTVRYIEKNSGVKGVDARLVRNILHYVSLQGMDLDDTLSNLQFLLDGVGISREELTRCLLGDDEGASYEA